MCSVVVLGGEFILLLFIGVMAVGCWSELRGGCFWEVSMFKSIGDIWFGCSREVGCFSEGLLIEVLLYIILLHDHFRRQCLL